MLIIIAAGDLFSDHNVNNITEDSLVALGFSVLEASPFIIGQSSPVQSAVQTHLSDPTAAATACICELASESGGRAGRSRYCQSSRNLRGVSLLSWG